MSAEQFIFVGTAPLSEKQELLGRENAIDAVRNQLNSSRIVLLYGPSGSGKTSLLEAKGGLKEKFESEGHFLKPRVFHTSDFLPKDGSEKLAKTIKDYPSDPGGKRRLLVIDQVEQCWKRGPTGGESRGQALFEQIRDLAFAHDDLFVLVVLQEEYLAPALALSRFIPGGFAIRYRLAFLSDESATQLVRTLLHRAGLFISVDDFLAKVKKDAPDSLVGIDPVRIQIYGRLLEVDSNEKERDLESLKRKLNKYPDENIEAFYLERALAAASEKGGLEESKEHLARWLEKEFIDAGVRKRVEKKKIVNPSYWQRGVSWLRRLAYGQKSSTIRLANQNAVVDALTQWNILRDISDQNTSVFKLELAHDRIVTALRQFQAANEDRSRASRWLYALLLATTVLVVSEAYMWGRRWLDLPVELKPPPRMAQPVAPEAPEFRQLLARVVWAEGVQLQRHQQLVQHQQQVAELEKRIRRGQGTLRSLQNSLVDEVRALTTLQQQDPALQIQLDGVCSQLFSILRKRGLITGVRPQPQGSTARTCSELTRDLDAAFKAKKLAKGR